ncbi:hypothetical protein EDB85DRAFT_1898676 [Lactarius pseudohatsudake]|nr:hypothetical protein EDB85DRAFT_1898676 [Lactarius pseudohatsudake]
MTATHPGSLYLCGRASLEQPRRIDDDPSHIILNLSFTKKKVVAYQEGVNHANGHNDNNFTLIGDLLEISNLSSSLEDADTIALKKRIARYSTTEREPKEE